MKAKGSCFSAGEGEGVWDVRGDLAPAQWDWPWRPSDELTPMKEVMVGDEAQNLRWETQRFGGGSS